jgi:Transposase DDE domain
LAECAHEAVLPFGRQCLPDRKGRPLAHRVIQASARPRVALGDRVSGIRRILSNYQRYLVWCIELFFKWIKQHLRIKRFYGTSENAVKTQIWIAVSVYVLVAIVRKRLKLDASLYTLMQVFSLTVFEKTSIESVLSQIADNSDLDISGNQLNLFSY